MSTRLQVVLEEAELKEIQEAARRRRLTVSEWVRQVLRVARSQEPRRDKEAKLEAIRAATRHAFPAPEIDSMLAEIEGGYLDGQEQ